MPHSEQPLAALYGRGKIQEKGETPKGEEIQPARVRMQEYNQGAKDMERPRSEKSVFP